MEIDINLHHRFRGDGVGAEAGIMCWRELAGAERCRGRKACVNEEDVLAVMYVERVFHLQLEVGKAFDTRQAERLDAFDEPRPERIVAPAGIAPAEDQYGYSQDVSGSGR